MYTLDTKTVVTWTGMWLSQLVCPNHKAQGSLFTSSDIYLFRVLANVVI